MARHHNVPDIRSLMTATTAEYGERVVVGRDRGSEVSTFPLEMTDDELGLFDLWALEHARIAGTPLLYYSLDVDRSEVDPVYNEPISRAYVGPFELKGVMSFPDRNPDTREEGLKIEQRGNVWLARKEVELQKIPVPHEGDIIKVWSLPFYKDWGTVRKGTDKSGYYFEVTLLNEAGHIFDTASFIGFELEVKRSTQFRPEEKLFPPSCE